MIASPLDSASHWLNWSNILYVAGAVLTVVAAMYVLYENRAIALGRRVKHYFLSEIGVAAAAIVSLIGTIGAIHFSNAVGHIKDVDLVTYKTQAKIDIANATNEAAAAELATARLEKENLLLENRQTGIEGGFKKIKEGDTHRVVKLSPGDIALLGQYTGSSVHFISFLGDDDADRIVANFMQALSPAITLSSGVQAGIAPLNPLSRSGVHIRYAPNSRLLASAIQKVFKDSDVAADVLPQDEFDGKVTFGMQKDVIVYLGPKP
jgi:hypothetical protein